MSDWTTTVNLALGTIIILYIGQRVLQNRSSHPLPPGPPGLPWIGNVIGINTSAPWITYAEWAKTYGDLVYVRLLGRDIVIINSEKIAKDLLETRSVNYSDRPNSVANDLCAQDFITVMMPYGDRWRLHKRFFHLTFQVEQASRFIPCQHRKTCHLLRQLLDTPEQLNDHVFEYTASIILNCTYDYDPASRKDELVEMAAHFLTVTVAALRPDLAVMMDAFPYLLYIPSWFPGMSFKRELARVRALVSEYLDRPFEHSLQNVRRSNASSMAYDALRDVQDRGISPEEPWMKALKDASGTAFLAATETSNSVLMTFFLMIMLNPTAQEKAQAQIDEVVGTTRLPTIDDRPSLPFIDAILRETLRYSPVAPLSIPRAAVNDDIYNGFRIPKGAVVLPNMWSMAHDETKYPNAHAFIPERFLNDDGTLNHDNVTNIAFGFGRRICAGRYFADTSVWTVIVNVLAVFKILRPLDENGVEITVEPRFSSGIAIHPLPFRYRIVPRLPEMDAEKLERWIAASIS